MQHHELEALFEDNTDADDCIPIWLDCDTGHDDAFAVLLAAHCPKIHLLGITTVHGNSSLENTTNNTLRVLEAIGRRDVPVYPGASKPLIRDAVHAPAIHGLSGLDGVPPLPPSTTPSLTHPPYTAAISTALLAHPPQTAWLIATGALTNIAHLFRTHPTLKSHIAGLSIMGGAIGNGFTSAPLGRKKGEGERFGNWTPYAEFNIYCDPEAAKGILEDEVLAGKTVLVPLDVTHQAIADAEVRRGLLHGERCSSGSGDVGERDGEVEGHSYSPVRALFHDVLTFFGETYDREFGLSAGPPLHDPLAVAAAVVPELFDDRGGERYRVEVDTKGEHSEVPEEVLQLGRTRVELLEMGEPGVRIPRTFDVDGFWWMIDCALGRAERATPLRREDVRGWAPRGG